MYNSFRKLVQSMEMCLNTPVITSALNRFDKTLSPYWPMVARYGASLSKSGALKLINFVFLFLKSTLGIKSSTITIAVCEELVFFPPNLVVKTKVLWYYKRVCHMTPHKLDRRAFKCRCIIKVWHMERKGKGVVTKFRYWYWQYRSWNS